MTGDRPNRAVDELADRALQRELERTLTKDTGGATMNKSNSYWLVAVATALLTVPACVTAERPCKEPRNPSRGPATSDLKPDFCVEETVSYLDDHVITVFVDESSVPPTVFVDPDELVVKALRNSGPKGIRWILSIKNRADYSLAAIEWIEKNEGGDGNQQFYPDLNAPAVGAGPGVMIHLIDKFEDEASRSYPYKVWITRKDGMKAPLSSPDPAVRNDPQAPPQ